MQFERVALLARRHVTRAREAGGSRCGHSCRRTQHLRSRVTKACVLVWVYDDILACFLSRLRRASLVLMSQRAEAAHRPRRLRCLRVQHDVCAREPLAGRWYAAHCILHETWQHDLRCLASDCRTHRVSRRFVLSRGARAHELAWVTGHHLGTGQDVAYARWCRAARRERALAVIRVRCMVLMVLQRQGRRDGHGRRRVRIGADRQFAVAAMPAMVVRT